MGHSQWSRFILGSLQRNYPCIDRKLKPALVYAIRVPRFALPSLPNPSEVNPSGFSAPYIICSSSLFHRPRPPTDLPPTQPSTRRLRASFLSDSFALWCLDLICFSRPPVPLSFFGMFISLSNFHLVLAGRPLHNFVHPAMVASQADCTINSDTTRLLRLCAHRLLTSLLCTDLVARPAALSHQREPESRIPTRSCCRGCCQHLS